MPTSPEKKMKIGYIVPSCSVSGGMAVICQHANRLRKRGHEVVYLSIVEIRPMDWFPGQQVPIHDAATWGGDLDIVVATGWSTAFWLPRIAARVKCYFVQSDETRFHPDDSRWQHLTTLTYYFGVHYLTEARWIREWLKNSFGHQAVLVPNGLDPEIFGPAEPLEAKGSKPRILLEEPSAFRIRACARRSRRCKTLMPKCGASARMDRRNPIGIAIASLSMYQCKTCAESIPVATSYLN